jgi:thiol-disulfide isomerase/thioredoxin
LRRGQEIQVRGQSDSKLTNGNGVSKWGDTTDWTFWVVRRLDEANWRLVLRLNTKGWSENDGKRSEQPVETKLCYFDLSSDGRIRTNESLTDDAKAEPKKLFVLLPPDAAAIQGGWEGDGGERLGFAHWKLSLVKQQDAKGIWAINCVSQTPLDKIYLFVSTSKFRFNTQRGLIEHAESELTQGWAVKYTLRETLDLVATKEHDEQWLKNFVGESDRYFTDVRAYHDLLDDAGHDADHAENCFSKSLTILKRLRDQLKETMFVDQVDRELASHKERAKSILDEAKWVSELKSKPATEWTVDGLDGRKHSLSDYRGKVVLLDFWFKGCGDCMMSMPHIQQVADGFKGKPVAVLGMSVDPDEKDARSVVETMHISYPVLKAADISLKLYHAESCPTLIVLDKHGVVRDVRIGYYQILRADMEETVKKLLAEN